MSKLNFKKSFIQKLKRFSTHLYLPNKVYCLIFNRHKEKYVYIKNRKEAKNLMCVLDIKDFQILKMIRDIEKTSSTEWVDFDDMYIEMLIKNNFTREEFTTRLYKLITRKLVKLKSHSSGIPREFALTSHYRTRYRIFIWGRNLSIPIIFILILKIFGVSDELISLLKTFL